jgi:hypothetical protein
MTLRSIAGFADEAERLAGGDGKIDAAHHVHRLPAAVEAHRQVFHGQERRGGHVRKPLPS